MQYTIFDEYKAAIQRAIQGKDVDMDYGVFSPPEGVGDEDKLHVFTVWSPIYNRRWEITIKIHPRVEDGEPQIIKRRLVNTTEEKAAAYVRGENELLAAIMTELAEAKARYAQRKQEQTRSIAQPTDATLSQDFVYRCPLCKKEFESKRDVHAHAPTHAGETETIEFELVDRDPAKRWAGTAGDILLASIPPRESIGVKVMKYIMHAIERYGADRVERDPVFAEEVRRVRMERENASKIQEPATTKETDDVEQGQARGGRPRNLDDEWAREQVRGGRLKQEVFKEWKSRIGERAKALADPQESFDKAIKKKPKKGEKSLFLPLFV